MKMSTQDSTFMWMLRYLENKKTHTLEKSQGSVLALTPALQYFSYLRLGYKNCPYAHSLPKVNK